MRPPAEGTEQPERTLERWSDRTKKFRRHQGDELTDEDVRRATTESLFRDVNERIAESAELFDAEITHFVCECSDASCAHRLETSLDEYEQVRSDGATFLLAPGHADGDIERVVADRGSFHVVEKVQRTVRATVQRLDPRASPA
jgi:hypothetical protein